MDLPEFYVTQFWIRMDMRIRNTDELSSRWRRYAAFWMRQWLRGHECFQHSNQGDIILQQPAQGCALLLRWQRIGQGQGCFIELHFVLFHKGEFILLEESRASINSVRVPCVHFICLLLEDGCISCSRKLGGEEFSEMRGLYFLQAHDISIVCEQFPKQVCSPVWPVQCPRRTVPKLLRRCIQIGKQVV